MSQRRSARNSKRALQNTFFARFINYTVLCDTLSIGIAHFLLILTVVLPKNSSLHGSLFSSSCPRHDAKLYNSNNNNTETIYGGMSSSFDCLFFHANYLTLNADTRRIRELNRVEPKDDRYRRSASSTSEEAS